MKKLNWNGETGSTSPYFHLRRSGLSHREAVKRLEAEG